MSAESLTYGIALASHGDAAVLRTV